MKKVLERIRLDDIDILPQTIAHHMTRYQFAVNSRTSIGTALDIACGTGYGTEMLRKAGYTAIGLDIDSDVISTARKEYPLCIFVKSDLRDIGTGEQFDLITMFEAIEHITFLEGVKALKKIKVILKKNGLFILSCPRDAKCGINPFHKSNWSYNALIEVLTGTFATVTVYGQDWDTAEITTQNALENDFYIFVCES